MLEKNTVCGAVAALALAMVGCVGGAPGAGDLGEEAGSSSDELLSNGEPLEELDDEQWVAAPPGCEGLLDGDAHFAVASAEHELVAAVEADGDVLCVDTVSAIEAELLATGRPEKAAVLAANFAATAEARAMTTDGRRTTATSFGGGTREGDPQPEPNVGWSALSLLCGDPQPEPNTGF